MFFVVRQSSEAGNLYGSVTARDIATLVQSKASSVNHHQVILDAPLKMVGVHSVTLRLHPEVTTSVIVSIAPSEEEAKNQTVKKEKASKQESAEKEAVKKDKKEKPAKKEESSNEEQEVSAE